MERILFVDDALLTNERISEIRALKESEKSRHASRRKRNYSKAIRKRNIDKHVHYSSRRDGVGWYDNLHQYSKNKIHCSCRMCSVKTKNTMYKSPSWGKKRNPPISLVKRMDEMDYEVHEMEY